jgi:hypothetical protein
VESKIHSRLIMGLNGSVKKMRENTRWKVPIRPTLIWCSVSHEYMGLVAAQN